MYTSIPILLVCQKSGLDIAVERGRKEAGIPESSTRPSQMKRKHFIIQMFFELA